MSRRGHTANKHRHPYLQDSASAQGLRPCNPSRELSRRYLTLASMYVSIRAQLPKRPAAKLFLVHEVTATVLLPALLVRLRAERLLLAVADGLDTISADTALNQGIPYGISAAVA